MECFVPQKRAGVALRIGCDVPSRTFNDRGKKRCYSRFGTKERRGGDIFYLSFGVLCSESEEGSTIKKEGPIHLKPRRPIEKWQGN